MMKLTSRSSHAACQHYYADRVVHVTGQPETEEEILSMQDLFLTPGFHCLQVGSIEEARLLIERYLVSLFCFKNIAVATSFDGQVPLSAVNIFDEYQLNQHGKNTAQHIDMSITELFYYDFLWIEADGEVATDQLYDALRASNIHTHTPIVTFILD
ncbi:hypothetical protein HOL34_01560 [bacterium]|nr:hypothetical protein [bacterium]MBT3903596.1 hypothetical protein [bacterium]MBT4577870.1 hypothetical protein [bacterium]MBT5345951.1 hypothetical protein [bacterium]MBT6130737.1 hypothetical protein [bacterium]